jgi:hypothetical protein
MSLELDPILDLFIGNADADTTEVSSDAFSKLIEDGALAAALGRSGNVAALHEETADFHARAEKLLKHAAPAPASRVLNDDTLAKAFGTHSERKRAMYKGWICESLAKGETVAALANHARRYDSDIALLIEEIGAELEAA